MRTVLRIFFLTMAAVPLPAGTLAPQKAAKVVVVQAHASVPAAERNYTASLAKRTVQALARNGVRADWVLDTAGDAAFAGKALAFCVACARPSPHLDGVLARFRARGGRIAPLYSASPELTARAGRRPFLTVKDDEAAKERQLLACVEANAPGVWNRAAWTAAKQREDRRARALAAAQRPRAGEIHAVWDHTGEGLYPGDWPRTLRALKANGVTDLFVNVAGFGFAHYASGALPRSAVFARRGDQLAACAAAARGTGVRVHAWLICFSAAHAGPAQLAQFARKGWRLKDTKGALTEYLDPSNAEVRWRLLRAVDEIAGRYAVDGVHLDFVRWYEGARKPADAARRITTFVEGARARVRAARPRAWLTAAVFGTPTCAVSVGQDWGPWLDRGLIDYAVPMNYHNDRARYAAAVARQGASPARARRTIGGIGVTARESRLAPAQVIDQINLARAAGFAGVALFRLDATLASETLPLLRTGLFR